jgi:hypothetical protein
VGPRAGVDRWGKSRPHRDSIPGPSNPLPVAIPTEIPGPLFLEYEGSICGLCENGNEILSFVNRD